MDQNRSRRLEDAFLAGRDSLVVDADDGWNYFYDLRKMTQTSILNSNEPLTTRAVQRVIGVSDV